MKTNDKIVLLENLKEELIDFNIYDIENGIMCYFLKSFNKPFDNYNKGNAISVCRFFENKKLPTDFETLIQLLEKLFDDNTKTEYGIAFTPKYISDYIVEMIFDKYNWDESKKFIDPSCGCGIFLISVAEKLYNKYKLNIDIIIENFIYGIDIRPENVRHCILLLRLLSAKYGGDFLRVKCNIICRNSLKVDWRREFKIDNFMYVIGNPPYINTHNLKDDTTKFLKKNFKTTTTGCFNIFYAFIECGMNNIGQDGALAYIIPNNFMSIKAAGNLRKYLKDNQYIAKIIDFGDNMIFKPIRTYNAIILLDKISKEFCEYFVMNTTDNIENKLQTIMFNKIKIDNLDFNGWNLVDDHTRKNIEKIENNSTSIKEFVRTGIATLKDEVFMVENDNIGFFKWVDNIKLYIEPELIKPIYKISELKLFENIKDAEKYIIFPYVKIDGKNVLISEEELINKYPLTYKLLLYYKKELDNRDKGRPNSKGWYAYGRTQGLNKYGKKILFPTFSHRPKFLYIENEDALFCNGYGLFENDKCPLNVLIKILNSKVMQYYIQNTSYCIEGGYYCYQKKYIEKFSIPSLTEKQIVDIENLNNIELDNYLWDLYNLE